MPNHLSCSNFDRNSGFGRNFSFGRNFNLSFSFEQRFDRNFDRIITKYDPQQLQASAMMPCYLQLQVRITLSKLQHFLLVFVHLQVAFF